MTRKLEGEFNTLYPLLRQDEFRFFMYFRMTCAAFDEFLHFIENDIRKEHTNYRECIEPTQRLAVTLR